MACPVCFFREAFQKDLKRSTFGTSRFEHRLRVYKTKFIEELRRLGSLAHCACHADYNHPGLVEWTDSFLSALRNTQNEIGDAFDNVTAVYESYVGKHQKAAAEILWSYLQRHDLLTGAETPIAYTKLLFRARRRSDAFDKRDVTQYFHIPFSQRHLVGNQRFSVSGQPMVYLGSSVLAVAKELGLPVGELAIAGFLPSYSAYYNSRVFSLTNHIGNCLENTLPGLFSAEVKVAWEDGAISPFRCTLLTDICRLVLFHLCTFPTASKGHFIAEYVIPQILTTALLEHGYCGIVFPSTKDYSDLSQHHRFSQHHLNLGLFVSYDANQEIDRALLGTFAGYTMDGSYQSATTQDVLSEIDNLATAARRSSENNNDFVLSAVNLKLHIEYLAPSSVNGTAYFDTEYGKCELELAMHMLRHLQKLLR